LSQVEDNKYLTGFPCNFIKLTHFFEPKVGPVGNGLSDTNVKIVWILFGISLISGVGGVIYFSYFIFNRND